MDRFSCRFDFGSNCELQAVKCMRDDVKKNLYTILSQRGIK
jgi:hypothetical protein